jgi:hypothetical protein
MDRWVTIGILLAVFVALCVLYVRKWRQLVPRKGKDR